MALLEELDRLLAEHEAALAAMERNLLDLETDSTYSLVRASTFAGLTAERARRPLQCLGELWVQVRLYREAVEAARTCRRRIGRFDQEQVQELEQQLTGPSVVVDIGSVPILLRSLTGDDRREDRLTMIALRDRMASCFDDGRDAVSAIDRAWHDLAPRSTSLRDHVARLVSQAPDIGAAGDPELGRLGTLLAALDTSAAHDPLGSLRDVERLELLATSIERRLAPLIARRCELPERLDRATTKLSEVRRLIAAGSDAGAASRAKIDRVATSLVPALDAADLDRAPNGPGPRLERLRSLLTAGTWEECAVGLDRLEPLLDEWRDRAEEVAAVNQAPLLKRDELRGLLSAAVAKASNSGLGEDAALGALADDARAVLYGAPCDLERASQLVARYLRAARPTGGGAGDDR